MSNIEAYDQNLQARLNELRKGDNAYRLNSLALQEAIVFSHNAHGNNHNPRILDCGCGLGFLTAQFKRFNLDVLGIDPSEKAIALAKKEHRGVKFLQAPAEELPQIMKEKKIKLFDQAILNMVLHSVDDSTVLNILGSLRQCLVPEGTVLIVTPTREWLVQKLIEYAQDHDMEREVGIMWVDEKLRNKKVELPVKIRGGDYWPGALIIYNRRISDYGDMLVEKGYGVRIDYFYQDTGEQYASQRLPYQNLSDYTANYGLMLRERELLMSFALID